MFKHLLEILKDGTYYTSYFPNFNLVEKSGIRSNYIGYFRDTYYGRLDKDIPLTLSNLPPAIRTSRDNIVSFKNRQVQKDV